MARPARPGHGAPDQGCEPDPDDALGDLLARFPEALGLHAAHAELPEQAGEHDEALRRWNAMRERFSDTAWGYIGQSKCLERLGRKAEAELTMTRAAALCPTEKERCIHPAIAAKNARDWFLAEQWWRACLSRSTERWWALLGIAEALVAREGVC